MASFAAACRVSARAAQQQVRNHGARRAFRAVAAARAAQNFNMPALSPTMTEGNIATWRVKEGDSFAAGDVLLEIETDKAQMDVEAQDDGILAKIIQGDGSKAVQVGSRIAVTAEPGDDISSLEMPAEQSAEPKQAEAPKETPKAASPVPKEERHASLAEASPAPAGASGAKAHKQKYPLYPSVQHLLKENGLPKEAADEIPATGPNGRLLKGDVLAYLGRVKADYMGELSKRIAKLAHLDLSNIKMAAPKEAAPKEKTMAAETPIAVEETEVELAVPVTFEHLLEAQEQMNKEIGEVTPITEFIEVATIAANTNLPRSVTAKPSADELFNAVLGLDTGAEKLSRGNFIPKFKPMVRVSPRSPKPDILDILSGKSSARSTQTLKAQPSPHLDPTVPNLLTVSVPKGDERRGRVFLQQLKNAIETGPQTWHQPTTPVYSANKAKMLDF